MNLSDIISIIGVFGGIVLFGRAIFEWRDAQQWKRAEKLEAFINEFETEPLLTFGRSVLDWTCRTVPYGERLVTIKNSEALLALRIHTEIDPDAADDDDHQYRGEQPLIRDSLDALLSFFDRLTIAVSAQLIDADHARLYFRYWLWKLVTYDAHPIAEDAPQRVRSRGTPEQRVAKYMAEYGNIELVILLCRLFGVVIPAPLERAESEARKTRANVWVEPAARENRRWLI